MNQSRTSSLHDSVIGDGKEVFVTTQSAGWQRKTEREREAVGEVFGETGIKGLLSEERRGPSEPPGVIDAS